METKGNNKYAFTNAKYSRFRLMNLLYLLFLVLAVIQISNAWLPMAEWVNDELRAEQEVIGVDNSALLTVLNSDEFQAIRTRLIELREMDATSEGVVDKVLVHSHFGDEFHVQLYNLFATLPAAEQEKLKNGMFAEDFDNGFEKLTTSQWSRWKFHHLTPALAEMVFEQMTLIVLSRAEGLGEASAAEAEASVDRWDIRDARGFRYVGDSIPLAAMDLKIQWSKGGKQLKDIGGRHYTLTGSDVGTWRYVILGENEGEVSEGTLYVYSKPQQAEATLVENTAFWSPGDTIHLFNSQWSSLSIDPSVGQVISSANGLFKIRFDKPGKHTYSIQTAAGDRIIREAHVNDFPLPELRTSVRWADLSWKGTECIDVLSELSEGAYQITGATGVIVTPKGYKKFTSSGDCISLAEVEEKPLAILFQSIQLTYRGASIEMEQHTINVL